jgi:hypothetical protein
VVLPRWARPSGQAHPLLVLLLRLPSPAGGWTLGRVVDRYGGRPVMLGDLLVRTGLMTVLGVTGAAGGSLLTAVLLLGPLTGFLTDRGSHRRRAEQQREPVRPAGAREVLPDPWRAAAGSRRPGGLRPNAQRSGAARRVVAVITLSVAYYFAYGPFEVAVPASGGSARRRAGADPASGDRGGADRGTGSGHDHGGQPCGVRACVLAGVAALAVPQLRSAR